MQRIIIIHWNKSTGPETILQYPPKKTKISKDLFLKIWAKHELHQNMNSMVNFSPEENEQRYVSIMQKVEGEIYFIVLVYNEDDNIENIINEYPDMLASIAKNLIDLMNTNKITRVIAESFNSIKNYTKLDKEENLLDFYKDKIKFMILNILRNGVISKLNLKKKLKEEYGFTTINLDLILMAFIRENLIKKEDLPGSKDCYFLVNDLYCTRLPPENYDILFDRFSDEEKIEIMTNYRNELVEFYQNFDCTQEEVTNTIIYILNDKKVFNLIRKLRNKSITVNNCISQLNNNDDLFTELLEKKFIYESLGYVFLFTDIRFIKFIPYYILPRLVERYNKGDISTNEFYNHIQFFTESLAKPENTKMEYEII